MTDSSVHAAQHRLLMPCFFRFQAQVLVISKNIGVLAAKLKEAKEKQLQQKEQKSNQGGDGGGEQDEDKFVEVVEPFLATSKVRQH